MESGEHAGAFTRRQALRSAAAGALALSSASALAACGSNSSVASTTTSTAGPIRRGGRFTVGAITGGTAETLNPAIAVSQPDWIRNKALFEGLYYLGPAGGPVPLLAESGEHDATAKVWTFRLRDGVFFHNGQPLTADDLLYTIKTWGKSSSYFNPVVSPLIDFPAVRKLDRLTVEMPLKLPVAELPSLFIYITAPIIPAGFTDFKHPVGTGPFKFKSFTPGSQSVFTRNADYWMHGIPYVDEFVVNSSFAGDAARTNALLAGEIDYAPQLPNLVARQYASGQQFQVKVAAGPQMQYFGMRVDTGPTRDNRVRQALRLLVDRKQMVQVVNAGFGTVTNDLPGYSDPYFASDLVRTHDPEMAKSLLKAAGQQNLHIQLTTSDVADGFVSSATLLKQQAATIGVTIDLKIESPSVFFTPAGGYTTAQFGMDYWGEVPSLTAFYLQGLVAKAPYNITHWGTTSASQDALIYDAVGAVDPSAAQQRWHAVQEQQFQQGGMIVWGTHPFIDGCGKNVHGAGPSRASFANDMNFRTAWLS